MSGSSPTGEQMAAMEGFVDEAMQSGALGMSTGLEFNPGREATADELMRLNAVAGRYDGIYTSHVRNRDSGLLEAIDEFLAVARAGGTRAEISHLNVRHNTNAPERGWERAVEKMAASRETGLDVLADTTPFREGLGQMAGILPPWVAEDGPEAAAAKLRDPALRARMRNESDRYWRFIHKGEWERVYFQATPQHPELGGMSFREISEQLGKDPWDCYLDILADAGADYEAILTVGTLFTDEHLAEMIGHPLFCLGVDTFTVQDTGPLAEIMRHPLGFAGHVHYLTHHVREQGTLRLEEAIRKMTSMPAAHFGLWDRGLLQVGYAADVVVLRLRRARRRLDEGEPDRVRPRGRARPRQRRRRRGRRRAHRRAARPAPAAPVSEPAIDLRSDLHAAPTEEMWEAMRSAKLGWATFGEDPSVNELQERMAGLLGKERALWVPTCGMANLVALLSIAPRGSAVVLEASSHVLTSEAMGIEEVAGLEPVSLWSENGRLAPVQVEEQIVETGAKTLVLENTHTRAGGTVLSRELTAALAEVAVRHDAYVHLDGARLFNAAVAQRVGVGDLAAPANTVAVSLNKALCAPMGAVLAGSAHVIEFAHGVLRRLGGASVHKAGLAAAAALVASRHPRRADRETTTGGRASSARFSARSRASRCGPRRSRRTSCSSTSAARGSRRRSSCAGWPSGTSSRWSATRAASASSPTA